MLSRLPYLAAMDSSLLTDIAKELIRVLGTIVGVIIGANVAFRNAKIGRRDDILLKEKYKLFDDLETKLGEIRLQIYTVRRNAYIVIDDWEIHNTEQEAEKSEFFRMTHIKELRESYDKLNKLKKDALHNARIKMLFSSKIDDEVVSIDKEITRLVFRSARLANAFGNSKSNNSNEKTESDVKSYWENRNDVRELVGKLNKLTDDMFQELELFNNK